MAISPGLLVFNRKPLTPYSMISEGPPKVGPKVGRPEIKERDRPVKTAVVLQRMRKIIAGKKGLLAVKMRSG